jgi:hypothetical protein
MRRGKIQGLRFRILLTCAWLALALSSGVESSHAQQRLDVKMQGRKSEATLTAKAGGGTARLNAELAQARGEYESSIEQLLSLYEADAKRVGERLSKMKELYEQGLVTRREMEMAESAAARVREKLAEARAQLKSADVQIAEAMVEAEAEESAPKVRVSAAPRADGGRIQSTAYIRYGGVRAWSLAEAGAIKQFFIRKFGRALPIGAFGQSLLHDRWGYDHSNAMDVGVSPDSAEGQILMEYLRASGIPFMAFRFAIPGKATGPHIHVGLPSHRITPTWTRASS